MSELEEFLADMDPQITLLSTHLGLRESDDGADWAHDLWSVEIYYKENKYRAEYRTGIGHRKPLRGLKRDLKARWNSDYHGQYNLTDKQAAKVNLLVKQEPKLADVMSCLLTASSNCDETFEDWCFGLGYDTDSRKALDMYLKCQETRSALIKMFGRELFGKLSVLEH